MAKRKGTTKIVRSLLKEQPAMADVSDDAFTAEFHKEWIKHGSGSPPNHWDIIRSRYKVKSEITGNRIKIAKKAKCLLEKARLSAQEAVAIYNNPLSPFKSGSYIILMHLAWTSLLLALIVQQKEKPYSKNQDSGKYIKRPEGGYQYLSLRECIEKLKDKIYEPVRNNLEFCIGIRNLVEHAESTALDLNIFGECQALLLNFEELLCREFGNQWALNESLAFSLQFSKLRSEKKEKAARLLHTELEPSIKKYIDAFRSSLGIDITNDNAYSFKVFLVPMVKNHHSTEALAVEWITDPEQIDQVYQVLVKAKHVSVVNKDTKKAGEVANAVKQRIKKPFNASFHHAKCWKYYQVRPLRNDPNPSNCKNDFCIYDPAHKDYLYTDKWIDHLVSELSDENKYDKIMQFNNK